MTRANYATWDFWPEIAIPEEEDMAKLDKLEERVANHIKFFWTVVAVGFAWLAWISIALYQMNGEIHEISRPLRAAQSPGKVLNEIKSLPPKEFASALPALRKVAEQPVAAVRPTQTTIREVTDKLRTTNSTTPEYWPAVLQFIMFASAGGTPNAPPSGKPGLTIGGNTGFPSFGTIRNNVVLLDGGEISNSIFENCRIIFTENAVRMRNVAFVNCVFELPVRDNPTDYLRQAATQLLASNLKAVSIANL